MKRTICVIDDTPDLLINLAGFLQMEGFDVFPCRGGREALQYLQNSVPDLIITDLWMPPMDGLALISEIRKDDRLQEVPIIIFSAKPPSEYEAEAKALGVAHYIKKPSGLEEILNVIYPLLNRKI
jgi:DNA-binding response OmpR family regulator